MPGQTYSPYGSNGRPPGVPTGVVGRPGRAPRQTPARLTPGVANPALAPTRVMPDAAIRPSRTVAPIDPNARRWVLLGALGIASSIVLTIGVALLGSREIASADQPVAVATPNRTTLVREIGGIAKSPTPAGTGSVSGPEDAQRVAPSDALRPPRRVGRATVAADGSRTMALGGAVPFVDAATRIAAAPADLAASILAWATPSDAHADDHAEADPVFLSFAGTRDGGFLSLSGPSNLVATAASPVASAMAATPAPTGAARSAPASTATVTTAAATSVPPTVAAMSTPVPATAVPATAVPATAVPATATRVPSTPVPPTAAPIVVVFATATPEPTRKPTKTPEPQPTSTPRTVVVTATPDPRAWPSSSQSVIPQTGYPQAGHPQAGYPQAGYPQAGYPQSGAAIQSGAQTPVLQPGQWPSSVMLPPAATPTALPTSTVAATATPRPTQRPVESSSSSGTSAAPASSGASGSAPAASSGTRRSAEAAPILEDRGTPGPTAPRTAAPAADTREAAPSAAPSSAPAAQSAASASAPATGATGATGATAAPTSGPREPSPQEKLAARALTAINAARTRAGALPLGRHQALDTASWLHAQYDVATGQVEGNFQASNTPLFVGETPLARVARANGGKPGLERVGEVMAVGEADPEAVVQGWLNSVFHRALLLDLMAQFGGYGQHGASGATSAVLDLAGRRDTSNASGWFPAAGATDVPTRCACDDYAEASGKDGPFGYPVTLLLGSARPTGMPTLARLTEGTEDGTQVAAELVDAFGNPTLVPLEPLKPATKYHARMQWTGGPDVTWSFTTGT